MGLTLADSYYLRANSATGGFSSDWEEVCETLNYALSYDESHCAALCLLGRIKADKLSQYKDAFECFDRVIAADVNYTAVYPEYAKYLIFADKIDRALKLIDFAKTIKGIDTAQLYWLLSYIEDIRGDYDLCLAFLKKAKIKIHNEEYYEFMESEVKRIKKKKIMVEGKKKVAKSKKKKKSKNKK